ncbi:MAG TPA: efflux transporter outer membrane subunit [Terriglobales bacterium]|nr:efflux transporter outer membrane subunit [Terriglobales bacterium]
MSLVALKSDLLRAGSRWALVFAGLGFLSGCAVGPRYAKPVAPAPPAYKEMPPNWKAAEPSDETAKGKWWQVFQDPQLDALEDQVNVSNQTLKAAQAQFEQARAAVRINRSAQYPNVTAGMSATRNHISTNRPNGRLSPTTNYTDLQFPLDASYEVDLWGRVRKTVEAARANAQASAADLENVSLSLHAELANDYFQLRALDAEEQLLNSTVAAYEKALELTRNRYSGGIVSQVDVAQAQTQLETTRAQAVDLGVQRAQFEHAIAVLTGKPASSFALPTSPLASTPPVVPLGLPSDLLERRPDVAGNERRMAAANAQIGIARAAYFPTIMLGASGGFESTSITTWFNGPAGFVTAGASAIETVFDAGRRRAVTDQARAAYDQSVANYRETVLGAFQEVEDSLAGLRLLEDEAKTQEVAVAAAQQSLQLSTNRYKGGVATYLEVITAQSIALTDQRAAVEIAGRRMAASVSLIKALGGGWNSASLPVVQKDTRSPASSGQ